MTTIRIETPRLIIRTPEIGDAAVINAAIHASAANLQAWMPWATPLPSLEQTGAYQQDAIAKTAADEAYPLQIFTHDGGFVGASGLHAVDWRIPKAEIGYWIADAQAGRGYASEASAAITGFALRAMGLRRVEIIVSDRNPRSWRIPERLGYRLEGILRCHRVNPDGQVDHTRIYARINEAPQAQEPWTGVQRRANAGKAAP
jgi:RimJ/RimL family protein N-acetyltransferase